VPHLYDDYTVVAFDRRGHGGSSSAKRYLMEDLREDVAAVVREFRLKRPVLVGHSSGSWDVLSYAANSTDVAAVICLDQAIATDDPEWRVTYQSDERSLAAKLAGITDKTSQSRMTLNELMELLARSDAHYGRSWDVYRPIAMRNIARRSDAEYELRPYLVDRVLIEHAWSLISQEPYDEIACPVVVALAQRNPGPIHEMFRRLAARRGLEFIMIDSDHDIHVEQPAAVVDLVRRFA